MRRHHPESLPSGEVVEGRWEWPSPCGERDCPICDDLFLHYPDFRELASLPGAVVTHPRPVRIGPPWWRMLRALLLVEGTFWPLAILGVNPWLASGLALLVSTFAPAIVPAVRRTRRMSFPKRRRNRYWGSLVPRIRRGRV